MSNLAIVYFNTKSELIFWDDEKFYLNPGILSLQHNKARTILEEGRVSTFTVIDGDTPRGRGLPRWTSAA
jgi:hypothetical protein